MDLFDVVFKLNGPVEPVGDSGIDAQRLANLQSLCNLTAELLECIASVADARDDHLASVKAAKDVAVKFMAELASGVPEAPALDLDGAASRLLNLALYGDRGNEGKMTREILDTLRAFVTGVSPTGGTDGR